MLSHVDDKGAANMVDVGSKPSTHRSATAIGMISMNKATLLAVTGNLNKKGDVLAVARVAGIMAAKNTSSLIPLCHAIALSKVSIEFNIDTLAYTIEVTATAKCAGQTGVEMEALCAVSVSCLTLFDMCKASDPDMCISNIKVLKKTGGKTGNWEHSSAALE